MKKITTLLLAILMLLPAMAHNLANNSKMYFAKPDDWQAAQFMLGHSSWSQGYPMAKISNTKLYYKNMPSWSGYTEWIVFEQSSEWGGEGNKIDNRMPWMGKHTTKGTSKLGTCQLLNDNGTFTTLSSYTALNFNQNVTVEGEGTISMSSYALSGDNTTKASTGTTTVSAAYTATVKCTATAADGYQFLGWYDGATLLSSNTTYSYTAPNEVKTITAKFEQLAANTPVLSNFVASSTNAKVGETVTFTCEIENGEAENIVYKVNDEAIEGNSWTPAAVGVYNVSANYEGAVSLSLEVVVYQEPVVEQGQIIAFFDNTTSGWSTVTAYVWTDGGAATSWPGEACTYLGNNLWQWVGAGNWATSAPAKIIFNNGGAGAQTADLIFVNGGVYNATSTDPIEVILPDGVVELSVPAEVFTGDEVALHAYYDETIFAGYTLTFVINGVEQSEAVWTPTEVGTYELLAKLTKGDAVKTSETIVVTVKQSFEVTVYLLKEGAWNTTCIYYWGAPGESWPGTAMGTTQVYGDDYFYFTFKNIKPEAFIFNNNNNGEQTVDIPAVSVDTYYKLGAKNSEGKYPVEVITPAPYAETIVKGDYYLNPGPWEVDEAWYAVYLFNKNNNPVTYTWVEGWLTNHMVIFGYTGEEAYTHMIFCRMNPAYNEMAWNDETVERVWNQTESIAYGTDKGAWSICNITGWEANNYEWGVIENPTALDRIETANGIAYAYGVVSAEGAIEVYNINGVVVARGNDNIDLRALNAGVYIVRNGNQVRKVVR